MAHDKTNHVRFPRRRFLRSMAAAAGLAATGMAGTTPLKAAQADARPFVFGLVTDIHYADADAGGSRHYRDSMGKLQEAVETFNRRGVSFVVELGDFVDAGPSKPREIEYLHSIDKLYRTIQADRHYVLGNHCLHAFTKTEFLANCGAKVKKSYYSFDHDRFHFVVLDANYTRQGVSYAAGNFTWTDSAIPQAEQKWLADDLAAAADKTSLVFLHQNLHDEKDPHGVKNAPEVRRVLETAGNVAAVFQGHMHTGGHAQLGGIDYITLKAMVEGPWPDNNAYAAVVIDANDRVSLEGFGRQGDVGTT